LAAQLWLKATINAAGVVAGSKGSKGSKMVIMVLRTALTVQGSRDGGGSRSDAG
jgi:hypothetical protein